MTRVFESALDLSLTYGAGLVDELVRLHVLPISTRTIRRYIYPAKCNDGVMELALRNFIRLAQATSSAKKQTDQAEVISCSLAIDGIALSRNLGLDPETGHICGTIPQTHTRSVQQHLDAGTTSTWESTVTWADTASVHCLTTLCGSATSPLAVYYQPKSNNASAVANQVNASVRDLQQCLSCLEDKQMCEVPQDEGPCQRCKELSRRCVRARIEISVMDSEAAHLSWQRSRVHDRPTIPDVAHICKAARNCLVNHLVLLEGYIVNTRMLLTLPAASPVVSPLAVLPTDKTSHRQLEQFLCLDIPCDTPLVLQLYPTPIGRLDSNPEPLFRSVSALCCGIGHDVIVDNGRPFVIQRKVYPAPATPINIHNIIDVCVVNDMSTVLLLSSGGSLYSMSVPDGAYTALTLERSPDHFCARRVCVDGATLAHGCLASSTQICTFSTVRKGIRIESVSTLRRAIGRIHDTAMSSSMIFLATNSGLVRILEGSETVIDKEDTTTCVEVSNGVVAYCWAQGVRTTTLDGSKHRDVWNCTFVQAPALSMLQNSIMVASGDTVTLISSSTPLGNFIKQAHNLYSAGGFFARREKEDMLLDRSLELIKEARDYICAQYSLQKAAAIGIPKAYARQGPYGFFPATLTSRMNLLVEGLTRLAHSTQGIQVSARAVQEDVVESVFSTMLRGRSTAPSVQDVGYQLPKVAQLIQLRIHRGAKTLFTFNNHHRAYMGLSYGGPGVPRIAFEMPMKSGHQRFECEREVLAKLQLAIGGRTRVSRIRGMSMAPLHTCPALHYRTYKPTSPTPATTTASEECTPLFHAHRFIAVRAPGNTVWFCRTAAAVLALTETVSVQWLEQEDDTWCFGEHDVVAAASMICDVSSYVTTQPQLEISNTGVLFAKARLEQELALHASPSGQESPEEGNPYRCAYNTTKGDRAKKHLHDSLDN